MLQGTAAQVEITVFETHVLACFGIVHDLKGRGLRLGEHAQVGDGDLDVAGGNVGILGAALTDNALCRQHKFAAARKSLVKNLAVGLVVERELHDARAVAQVDKNQLSKVAHTLHPAADRHLAADVRNPQIAAIMRAL